MTLTRLKGINVMRRKLSTGEIVEYHYIRNTGIRFWRTGDSPKGSQAYTAAYTEAYETPAPINRRSFEYLVDCYQDSPAFQELKPRTQKDYIVWIDRIKQKFGAGPMEGFDDPRIRQAALEWRNNWSGRQAKYAWQVLGRIVSWAYDAGYLSQHHLRGGGVVYKPKGRAEIIWTEADVNAFLNVAPDYVGRVLIAAIETGLRPGDLINLNRAHILHTMKARRVQIRTRKRDRVAGIPVTQRMADLIDSTPKDQFLLLLNSKGDQFTEIALSRAVATYRDKAHLDKRLRLYDARGTAVTRLFMAGANLQELAVNMGWSVKYAASMIETYAALDPGVSDDVLVKLERYRK